MTTDTSPARTVTLYDVTLRDGQHAIAHQLDINQIVRYAEVADDAGIPVIEVGHGNGLGASSLHLGQARLDDKVMLATARKAAPNARLAAFLCPGTGTFNDIDIAHSCGVDILRIGVHVTGADFCESYIGKALDRGLECHAVLMMSHMADLDELVVNAKLLASYGCTAVGIMDSAGHLLPEQVTIRIGAIRQETAADVSFHAHNNLGLATANVLAAIDAGAVIIDASSRGFGAGAGNAQLEIICALSERLGYSTGVSLDGCLRASEVAGAELIQTPPIIDSVSLVSGLAGVFSGFKRKVLETAANYGVSPWDIFFELGRMQAIAGQEDLIPEAARRLVAKPTVHPAH
ncbi:4-hydroxy-2-oxovalerate aldolase [Nocardia sp. NPDC051570]|uniref:4-hydroxy-2-oxovalerate aldolase n=1 Tax=Nocardia sp. NPDC051570 TaxID=3364324 RepID=UPI003794165C